jgi:hypothetical protein
MHRFTHLFVILALACPVFAQNPQPVAKSTMRMPPRPFPGLVVTGAPYSAQRVGEHVQVAPDGTRFTSSNHQETIYRDSEGRTRTERSIIKGPNATESPMIIEINDPVANVGYTLETEHKIAHRFTFSSAPIRVGRSGLGGGAPMPNAILGAGSNRAVLTFSSEVTPPMTIGMISAVPPVAATNAHPDVSQEQVGPQMIEGVMAKGNRTIQKWATGTQGNDRPFQVVFETWFSAELHEIVLTKNSDPRSGETTVKLTYISRVEPDPSLFALPPDYTVVDETSSVEMQLPNGPRQ